MKSSVKFWFILFAAAAVVVWCTFLFSREVPGVKLNARLECSYEAQDGTIYRYPGNGLKVKPRIDGTINCWISLTKLPSGVALKGKLKANGKTQDAEVIPRPDDTYSADASFSPENGDFEACSAFTVTGELVRGGTIAWKKALRIDQICHD